MKTGILIGIAAAALSLFCGCAPTMTVNGQTYTILTQSEEQELVTQARRLLGRPGKALNKEEVRFVQKTDPEVKIEYQGDRTGEAQVIWRTPEKSSRCTSAANFSPKEWAGRSRPKSPCRKC